MGSLSKAQRDSDDGPEQPVALREALRHNLHYPGYVVRLNDGTMVHAASVNDKHAGMVTLYRGRVEHPGKRPRELAYRGEDFPLSDIVDAWTEPPPR